MREAVKKTEFPDLCLKPALTDGALQKRSTPFERPLNSREEERITKRLTMIKSINVMYVILLLSQKKA
jgi:hypothetical protein